MEGNRWCWPSCRLVICLVSGLVMSSPVAAQIYKCESHGQVAYQDAPCPGDPPPKIIHKVPPLTPTVSDVQASTLVTMPPALDESTFKAPTAMSLPEIYGQLQMLGQRTQALHQGMDRDMQRISREMQDSVNRLKDPQEIMTEWAAETRKSVRQMQSLDAESTGPTRRFVKELRAVLDKPLPSGNIEQRSRAMDERQQAIARLHEEWDPKIRENQRVMSAAHRAMEQQNRSYQQKLDSYDRQREIRALRERYLVEAGRVRERWLPRIRVVEARRKALLEELRRRCPHGASLSPHDQRCYQ